MKGRVITCTICIISAFSWTISPPSSLLASLLNHNAFLDACIAAEITALMEAF